MFYTNPLLQKNIQSDMNYELCFKKYLAA